MKKLSKIAKSARHGDDPVIKPSGNKTCRIISVQSASPQQAIKHNQKLKTKNPLYESKNSNRHVLQTVTPKRSW